MNVDGTTNVLAKIQAFDRRTIGNADVLAWHEAIGDLPLDDCLDAVTQHYRQSSDWLTPAHIRALALDADKRRRAEARRAEIAHLRTIDGEPLALDTGTSRPSGGPAPAVREMIRDILARLPSTHPGDDDAHARARRRAQRERTQPIPAPQRPTHQKPPSDHPEPRSDEVAALARRYLVDGHEPNAVGDRLAVSRAWCRREARAIHASPTAAVTADARRLHRMVHPEDIHEEVPA